MPFAASGRRGKGAQTDARQKPHLLKRHRKRRRSPIARAYPGKAHAWVTISPRPLAQATTLGTAAPGPQLGDPGESAQPKPERRQQHVEDEVRDNEDRPPEHPVPDRNRALFRQVPAQEAATSA